MAFARGVVASSGPLPVLGLRERMRTGMSDRTPEWAKYLPARLRPAGLPPPQQLQRSPGRESQQEVAAGNDARAGPQPRDEGAPVVCPLDQAPVLGNVWQLSQDRVGCRRVQAALDDAGGDAERERLVGELRGHVLEGARCAHANHVLQKAVVLLRPSEAQFIAEELTSDAISIAKHKYGCRVVQRVIEHLYPEQVQSLLSDVLVDICGMSAHPYGSYVVQSALQHGRRETRREILSALEKNLRLLGAERHSWTVLAAAIAQEGGVHLAMAIAEQPALMAFMAPDRHGSATVMQMLEALEDSERMEAIGRLLPFVGSMRRTSAFGGEVADYLEARLGRKRNFVDACAMAGA